MNTLLRWTRLLYLLTATLMAKPAFAADLNLPRDGWASWQVPTVSDAPEWCCFGDWRDGSKPVTCQLDGRDFGYGSRGSDEKMRELRVYAKFAAGKLEKLRALSVSCPVNTASTIKSIDQISVDDSARWLAAQVSPRNSAKRSRENRLASDTLAALAAHRGEVAREALAAVARKDASVENRKDALFWATQARGAEGVDLVAPRLVEDSDPRVREHAAFALAQSRAKPVASFLIRAGNIDRDSEVRSKAWFWLSQSKATETENAIRDALKKEADQHVRHQAIFALSQLPEARAVPSLAAVAEDKSLSREDRKQAIFWLGQMKSDEAVRYLDRVLSAKSSP